MTNANILRTLKKAAGNCKWSRKEGRYRAIQGKHGMWIEVTSDMAHYQIVNKALAVQKELIAATKGALDAETKELWARQTRPTMGAGATSKTVEAVGK